MSATDTAIRVIDWALSGRGPVPRGDIRLCDELARPSAELRSRVAALCNLTCAQLGWRMPPLGDGSVLGMDTALMAASIGFPELWEISEFLLRGAAPGNSPVEWAARHGLVSRAAEFVPAIAPTLRALSPLTPLFDHASDSESSTALGAAEALRAHPDGRRSLIHALARPTASYRVRHWRTRLLEQWRTGVDDQRALVLQVYEAMLVFHEKAAQVQIGNAVVALRSESAAERVRDALSVGNWWRPLALIQRNHPDLLRGIRHLRTSYRRGLELSRLASRLQGDPS